MSKAKSTGMVLHGLASAQVWDSTAEMALIDGMDITDIEEGRCVLNLEHLQHEQGLGQEVVGKVIYGKKLFKLEDCENAAQRRIWSKHKVPALYIVARLYDLAGNPGAVVLASAIRDADANGDPLLLGLSVEGSTVQRQGGVLEKTIIKKVAATYRPANKVCYPELLYDPGAPEGFDKVPGAADVQDVLQDVVEKMAKSESVELGHTEKLRLLVKAAVVQKLAQKADPLDLFKKLSPQYLTNGMAPLGLNIGENEQTFVQKVRNAPITINFSPAQLGKILRNGYLRNMFQHEAGTQEYDDRRQHEHAVLGIPLNTWAKYRPIYGALHLEHANPDPYQHALGGAPLYGSAFWVLKPHVKERSSFTPADSFLASPQQVFLNGDLDKAAGLHLQMRNQDPDPLIEAQIHGGVDLAKDVDSLCVHSEHPEVLKCAQKIGQSYSIAVYQYLPDFSVQTLWEPMRKDAAPGALVQGAALAREVLLPKKKKVKDLLWTAFTESGQSLNKAAYTAFLKHVLPEVSDKYVDYYQEAVENVEVPKKILRKSQILRKIECLAVELQQVLVKKVSTDKSPGKATVQGKLHYLVSENPEHYLAHPHDQKDALVKLPKADAGKSYRLIKPIQFKDLQHTLEATHGLAHLNQSPEQHALVDGLKLNRVVDDPEHAEKGFSDAFWVEKGTQKVFVKPDTVKNLLTDELLGKNEVVVCNLAKNFFGLGDHVPLSAALRHPDTQVVHIAQETVPEAKHSYQNEKLYKEILAKHAEDGTLDKLGLMDFILGSNVDRHPGNVLVSPVTQKLHLIDNVDSLREHAALPNYLKDHDFYQGYEWLSNPMHPEAQSWLNALDRHALVGHLGLNGVSADNQKHVMRRFDAARENFGLPRRQVYG